MHLGCCSTFRKPRNILRASRRVSRGQNCVNILKPKYLKTLSCSLSNGTKYTMKMFRIFQKKATANTGSFSEPKKPSNYLKFGSIKLLHRTFREDLIMSIGLLHVCAKIVCFLFFVYIFGLLKIWAYLCVIFVLQNSCVFLL